MAGRDSLGFFIQEAHDWAALSTQRILSKQGIDDLSVATKTDLFESFEIDEEDPDYKNLKIFRSGCFLT
jgi:hypothetical protein